MRAALLRAGGKEVFFTFGNRQPEAFKCIRAGFGVAVAQALLEQGAGPLLEAVFEQ